MTIRFSHRLAVCCAIAAILAPQSGVSEHYWGTVWDDDTVRSWTCGASGFYGIEVAEENNPKGTIRPFAEVSDHKFSIEIKKDSNARDNEIFPGPYYFYITSGIPDRGSNPFTTGVQTSRIAQIRDYHGPIDKLEDVTVLDSGNLPLTLRLSKGDTDWRFVLSRTSLNTARDVRRLKIRLPGPDTASLQPESRVSFLRGMCIEDETPNNYKPPKR